MADVAESVNKDMKVFVVDSQAFPPQVSVRRDGPRLSVIYLLLAVALLGVFIEAGFIVHLYNRPAVSPPAWDPHHTVSTVLRYFVSRVCVFNFCNVLQMFALTICTHTHTHTDTHVGFYGLRGLSIGVMVFILYKLYVLLPYTYPTPKLSPHRRRCISIFPQKNSLV